MTIQIRPATPVDQPFIRALVRSAQLNPINLRWPNFVVAEVEGRVVGIGQLRPHSDGSKELSSLVVTPEHRGRGIGGQIVQALLSGQTGPIYLFCEPDLERYYARYRFQRVEPRELPKSLARMHRMASALMRIASLLARRDVRIIAMHWG